MHASAYSRFKPAQEPCDRHSFAAMIVLLSPAKKLTMEGPLPTAVHSLPDRLDQSAQIMAKLKTLSKPKIAALMKLSPQLTELNQRRYEAWHPAFTPDNARPAALAFAGDVYQGLDASSLKAADLKWAQNRIRILSGLHGMLKPLDLIQAYRLEMGSKLPMRRKKNLYEFWGEDLARAIASDLAGQPAGERFVLNLASAEYARAAKLQTLDLPVYAADFLEAKNGDYKAIQFYLKQARGHMARWIIQNRVRNADQLSAFDGAGYRFDPDRSEERKLVFVRDVVPSAN